MFTKEARRQSGIYKLTRVRNKLQERCLDGLLVKKNAHLFGSVLVDRLDLVDHQNLILRQKLEFQNMIIHQMINVYVALDVREFAAGFVPQRETVQFVTSFQKEHLLLIHSGRKTMFEWRGSMGLDVQTLILWEVAREISFRVSEFEEVFVQRNDEPVDFIRRDFLDDVRKGFVQIEEDAGVVRKETPDDVAEELGVDNVGQVEHHDLLQEQENALLVRQTLHEFESFVENHEMVQKVVEVVVSEKTPVRVRGFCPVVHIGLFQMILPSVQLCGRLVDFFGKLDTDSFLIFWGLVRFLGVSLGVLFFLGEYFYFFDFGRDARFLFRSPPALFPVGAETGLVGVVVVDFQKTFFGRVTRGVQHEKLCRVRVEAIDRQVLPAFNQVPHKVQDFGSIGLRNRRIDEVHFIG